MNHIGGSNDELTRDASMKPAPGSSGHVGVISGKEQATGWVSIQSAEGVAERADAVR